MMPAFASIEAAEEAEYAARRGPCGICGDHSSNREPFAVVEVGGVERWLCETCGAREGDCVWCGTESHHGAPCPTRAALHVHTAHGAAPVDIPGLVTLAVALERVVPGLGAVCEICGTRPEGDEFAIVDVAGQETWCCDSCSYNYGDCGLCDVSHHGRPCPEDLR